MKNLLNLPLSSHIVGFFLFWEMHPVPSDRAGLSRISSTAPSAAIRHDEPSFHWYRRADRPPEAATESLACTVQEASVRCECPAFPMFLGKPEAFAANNLEIPRRESRESGRNLSRRTETARTLCDVSAMLTRYCTEQTYIRLFSSCNRR